MATKLVISAIKKGGSGKSTIITNQAALWAMSGKKVLLIDLDAQGNVLLYFGVNPSQYKGKTLADIIENPSLDYRKCLFNNMYLRHIDPELIQNLDILPSNFLLKLQTDQDKQTFKKIAILINKIKKSGAYDYICVDTNPDWNVLLATLFNFADCWLSIFEPASANYDALEDIISAYKDQKSAEVDPNPNMKLIVVPNKVALKFRKDKETGEKKAVENFNYQYLEQAKKKIKNVRNVSMAEPISKSDQVENAISFYHKPLVLITDKIEKKPFAKLLKQMKILNEFITSKLTTK